MRSETINQGRFGVELIKQIDRNQSKARKWKKLTITRNLIKGNRPRKQKKENDASERHSGQDCGEKIPVFKGFQEQMIAILVNLKKIMEKRNKDNEFTETEEEIIRQVEDVWGFCL